METGNKYFWRFLKVKEDFISLEPWTLALLAASWPMSCCVSSTSSVSNESLGGRARGITRKDIKGGLREEEGYTEAPQAPIWGISHAPLFFIDFFFSCSISNSTPGGLPSLWHPCPTGSTSMPGTPLCCLPLTPNGSLQWFSHTPGKCWRYRRPGHCIPGVPRSLSFCSPSTIPHENIVA